MNEIYTRCFYYEEGYCIILDDKCKPTSARCLNSLCNKQQTTSSNKPLKKVKSVNKNSVTDYKTVKSSNCDITTYICFSDKYSEKRKCPICGFTLMYQKLMVNGLDKNMYKCCIRDNAFFIPEQYRYELKQSKTSNGASIVVKDEKEILNMINIVHMTGETRKSNKNKKINKTINNTKLVHNKKQHNIDVINAQETSIRKTCIRCGRMEYYNGYCWDCYKKYKHIGNK